jgi:hypothetical protein
VTAAEIVYELFKAVFFMGVGAVVVHPLSNGW